MNREPVVGGGVIVRLQSGALAVEGVPNARRGLVVSSDATYIDGAARRVARYEITRRVAAGSDLWHVVSRRPNTSRYAVVQAGIIGRERYASRKEAEAEAQRLNAEADNECGHEVVGDGAASVIEVVS